ncbi:MAG: branched-chain amino acid ABC transporter permease [Alphaproteobacteria bacterium]|nr:branched-chain amino acid ABC transporter permease [Alphaproteobacteria bacterium]
MPFAASKPTRILAALGLLILLAACSDLPHEETCLRVLEALAGSADAYKVLAVEHDPEALSGVVVRFQRRAAFTSARAESRLRCLFTGSARAELRRSLVGVELDGQALSRVKLILLHRWLRQPAPPELLHEEAPRHPWPLGLHVAYLAQQVLNGLVIGSVIALVAVGYTLVYGITRHVQFAYGELLTIGAVTTVVSYGLLAMAGWGNFATMLALALPAVVLLAALQGWSIERAVFRRLHHSGTQSPLIAAVGLSIFLQEFVRLSQGARSRWMPSLLPGKAELFTAGGFAVSLTYTQIMIVLLAVALSLGQGWVLAATPQGRAYRAAAQDPLMAAMLGIDVNRVVALTYAAGAALAAVAGAAIVLHYGQAGSLLGVLFGFKALTAAVLGGIGSFAGALVGGIAIGLAESLWAAYLGGDFRDAAVFAILVLVLVFKPAGLFGPDDPFTPAAGGPARGSAVPWRPTAPFRS